MCLCDEKPFQLPLTRVPEDQPLLNLKDKVVLVTGGSRGIGQATCVRFAAAGCRVIGTSRYPELYANQALQYKIVPLDVRSDESVAACIQSVIQEFGHIDVLVNSAGIGQYGRLIKAKPEDWINLFQTNLLGVHRVTVAAYEHMKRPDSRIITMGSLDGEIGWPYQAMYAISKRALQMWNDSFDFEMRNENGPRFTLLEPAFVDTSFGVSPDIVNTEPQTEDTFACINQKLFPQMLKEFGISADTVAQSVYIIAALQSPRLRYFVGAKGPLILGQSLEDILTLVYQYPSERILALMDRFAKMSTFVP